MKNLDYFLSLVEKNQCSTNMYVDLTDQTTKCGTLCTGSFSNYHNKDLRRLVTAVSSGRCYPGLNINLWGNFIGNSGAEILSNALRSNSRPPDFILNLTGNAISDKGIISLVHALEQGPKTRGVRIICTGEAPSMNECGLTAGENKLGDKGLEYIANSLRRGQWPEYVYFDFSFTKIPNKGALALVDALDCLIRENRFPRGLYFEFSGVQMDPNLYERIKKALQVGNQYAGYGPNQPYQPAAYPQPPYQPSPNLAQPFAMQINQANITQTQLERVNFPTAEQNPNKGSLNLHGFFGNSQSRSETKDDLSPYALEFLGNKMN